MRIREREGNDRCWIPGNNRFHPRRTQHMHNRLKLPCFAWLSRTRWWLQNCWWCYCAGQFYSMGCSLARQNVQWLDWPVRRLYSFRALGRHCGSLLPRHSSKIHFFNLWFNLYSSQSPANSANTTNTITTRQASSLSQPIISSSTPNITTPATTVRKWTTTFACSSSKKTFSPEPRTKKPSSPSVYQLKTSLMATPAGLLVGEPLATEALALPNFNLSASASWTTTTAWTSHLALIHKKVIITSWPQIILFLLERGKIKKLNNSEIIRSDSNFSNKLYSFTQ